ncbi:hypothetical protein DID73_01970 [Candidatus Marinamargulisbacteria bacterium SCGC AG-343-K17]|nr:hypothetical protein DID73_01970 [Candidatus Marinamargulisbacteria bacterium SCGC AG-343-K17]
MKKNIVKITCIIFILIILFALYFQIRNKEVINVGKSSWPSWDLFELSQKNNNPLSNFKLQFNHYENYDGILDAFINNKIDIATVTLLEALTIQNNINEQIKIILLLDYTIGSDAILSHSNIEHLHELEGKTIGFEKNTISYYTLLRSLEKANINPNNLTLKNLSLEALITEFKQKKIDAISLYDPYIYELKKFDENFNIIFSSKEIPREICDVVIIRSKLIDKYPGIVQSIQNNWFNKIKKDISFKGAVDPLYRNNEYLSHIKENIYFANKNENMYAFGTKKVPGYLNNSISKTNEFLEKKSKTTTEETKLLKLIYN